MVVEKKGVGMKWRFDSQVVSRCNDGRRPFPIGMGWRCRWFGACGVRGELEVVVVSPCEGVVFTRAGQGW